MIQRQGTWGEVEIGTTLLSPNELPLIVVKTAPTKKGLWYLAQDHQRRDYRISPKPSDAAVTLLEATPEEAELLASEVLGARHVLEMEREQRMPARAKHWIVPPFPSKGRGVLNKARDHLSWYHGTYTTDIRTLKQAAEAHAEMHTEPLFMDLPHTHAEK